MPIATNELLNRDKAVRQIADHIADRDSYVITVPPTKLGALAAALAKHVPSWNAYLDNATGMILRTPLAGTVRFAERFAPTAAVVTVPKTIPAGRLSEALGQPVPPDGSQDIVILCTPGQAIFFPTVFVDALDIVDPHVAARLRANQLQNLN